MTRARKAILTGLIAIGVAASPLAFKPSEMDLVKRELFRKVEMRQELTFDEYKLYTQILDMEIKARGGIEFEVHGNFEKTLHEKLK